MVELSTTVYIMSFIVTFSPTDAFGHLQVPCSKYILVEFELSVDEVSEESVVDVLKFSRISS